MLARILICLLTSERARNKAGRQSGQGRHSLPSVLPLCGLADEAAEGGDWVFGTLGVGLPVSRNGDCRGSEMAGRSPTGLSVIWSLLGPVLGRLGGWRPVCGGVLQGVDPLLGCNFSRLATMRTTAGTWLNSK